MTRHVDLDAALALDEPAEPKSFTFRGEEWLLPGDLPIDILGTPTAIDIWKIMIDEGAPGQLERFEALRPRVKAREMAALDKAYQTLYGSAVGESSASVDTSASTGDRSRPTSSDSTGSNSHRPAVDEVEYRD